MMKRFRLSGVIIFLLGGILLLAMASSAVAKVVYVSPTGNDLNNGRSWAQAKRTVKGGLQAAVPGDQVWVRYGVYVERITLKDGVSLYGGFRGNESTLSERPAFPRPSPDPYETVLDGDQRGSVVTSPDTANRAYRLDGFTIRNGRAESGGGLYLAASASYLTVANCTISGNSANSIGGGVYCGYSSSPTLSGCTITGNSANSIGGGVYCDNSSSPTLSGCTISGNSAYSGGGMYGSSTLTSCTITGNSATYGGGVYGSSTLTSCTISGNSATYGGGVYGSSTLTSCTISGNSASYFGGGVYCSDYSSPTLSGCTISGNSANNNGGGVYCGYSSSPTLSGCTITQNHASYGGGMYCTSSRPMLNTCTITGNSADYGGGVLCVNSSSLTLSECIISRNSAYYGGAIYCVESSQFLKRCTISDNTAAYEGGGVLCYYSLSEITGCNIFGNIASFGGGAYCFSSTLTLTGCDVSCNRATDGGGVYCEYSSSTLTGCTVSYNIGESGGGIWTDSQETKVRNSIVAFNTGEGIRAPALAEFRHNCVWSNVPVNFAGDIGDPIGIDGNISVDPLLVAGHLLPGSPCIGAGDNSVVSLETDIDGEPRIADGTVDIGADEFHPPIVQGYLVFNDFAGSLPPTVDWEIRTGSSETRTLLLDPDGGFVVPRVPVGQFALSVKPLSYLRRTVEVDTSGGSVLGLEISLVNGDIDGDNEVTLFDFGALVAAFGSAPGDGNWNPRADLDGDGEVTLFDFGILVRNLGEIGDE